MEIAICTLTGYGNYGNRLQNYALQEVLKSQGHNVSTIKNFHNSENSIIQSIAKRNSSYFYLKKMKAKYTSEKDYLRLVNFLNFTEQNIREDNNVVINSKKKYKNFDHYDAFVIGSDQVWNPNFSNFSILDFAPYANEDQLVLSYAASFGISEIPNGYENIYKEGFQNLDFISVREDAGRKLVRNLVNRESEVVLDPTLLLSKEKWEKIAAKSSIDVSGNYILTYFLGDLTSANKDYIYKYAKQFGYEVISLGDRNNEYWTAGPEDFVKLFKNAKTVFTDSFHACAFSIIFEKYFEVFQRNSKIPSMNSRLDTLFSDLELENRWHRDSMNLESVDYKKVNDLLEKRKEFSMQFLLNCLRDSQKLLEADK